MMDRKGIALRRDGSAPADIFFDEDGHLVMVENTEAVGQHARQRLMTHEGEWFLDRTAGVPWVREILGHAYDPVLAESIIKAELLDTDGVTEINSFSIRFDLATRGLGAFNIDVMTIYNEEVSLR